ncbi:MAG: hypothetical protein ACP5UN_03640, partial [Candidatus Micrarchaeia archaeon]
MEVTRAYKFRIYPDAKKQREIGERLVLKRAKLLEKVSSKATLGQRESHAQGESVRPQQEAVLEELRTDKTHPLH